MPRQPRLDAPGLLQHVMARGIEPRKIFLDDKDRQFFLDRLAVILEETQTQCYAWALIPNHFHLLLRTGPTPLSKVMRKLMTGYAVTFNKRHKRAGHLFQNRYKSIICEEDPYLLELIRYIHLNPLRAKLVQELKDLDNYSWAGHSAILGRGKNPLVPDPPKELSAPSAMPSAADRPLAEKTIEDVLLHFGETKRVARRRYREFVEKGIPQGRRPEFQGGGLVRSAGGNKAGLLGRKKDEREKGDARILGSSAFVDEVLETFNESYELRMRNKISLDDLIQRVIADTSLEMAQLMSPKRDAKTSKIRSIISFLAVNQLGMSATAVADKLGITGMAIGKCADRAGKRLDTQQIIAEYLQ
jgi:putative transposase